ncbi:hypothetical protein GQ43DRAFT_4760 [Delitschia confertaspora ATCC 74209]|uniref:Uncharacterized protein n=1 Tax=Delitschia confertaspora ATCC 74209 TaxID=1513339 RepID=A0A9P4N361_9PLEO|nr:hypothetical protein GQ43DRAFT_4760 [Delitschia confertaspora ATCC 74209]
MQDITGLRMREAGYRGALIAYLGERLAVPVSNGCPCCEILSSAQYDTGFQKVNDNTRYQLRAFSYFTLSNGASFISPRKLGLRMPSRATRSSRQKSNLFGSTKLEKKPSLYYALILLQGLSSISASSSNYYSGCRERRRFLAARRWQDTPSSSADSSNRTSAAY